MTKPSFSIHFTLAGGVTFGHTPTLPESPHLQERRALQQEKDRLERQLDEMQQEQDALLDKLDALMNRVQAVRSTLADVGAVLQTPLPPPPPPTWTVIETFADWNTGQRQFSAGQRILKQLEAMAGKGGPELDALISGEGWPQAPYLPMLEARLECARALVPPVPQEPKDKPKPARFLICQRDRGSRGLFTIEDEQPPGTILIEAFTSRGLRKFAFDEGRSLMGQMENQWASHSPEQLDILAGIGWDGTVGLVERLTRAMAASPLPTLRERLEAEAPEAPQFRSRELSAYDEEE
jgi:uncharacterized coiled-coil protein SlyX